MRQSVARARKYALLVLSALAVPAAACPVSTIDGEFDLAGVDITKFSPVSTMKTNELPPRSTTPESASPCQGGFAGTYPCNNIDLMSVTPNSALGGGDANDIWGWTDPVTGKEYALLGRTSGTSFVDISDPAAPVYLGNLPTHTGNSLWRDVKVHADHAFIVSEAGGHGMQVFDLKQLRSVTNPPATFSNTAHYDQFGNAHNIAINEESAYAYAVGTNTCSGGLHMVDISNPSNPTNAGCYSGDGYTHDVQCVIFGSPGAHRFHHGSELCFAANEDTLTIVDVTDKTAPVQLARLPYAGSGYSHQGWLSDDHQYFYLDDELDENAMGHNTKTRVFDVSDPERPFLIDSFLSSAAAIDHNLYVRGDYIYQANYRAGLRILKAIDSANGVLVEEGFFDVFPTSDSTGFNGAWSNYPYFDSGVVIISSIEQGLFVVKPTTILPSFEFDANPTLLEVCGDGSAATVLSVNSIFGYSDTIAFSVNGLPAGGSASFNPPSLVPPAASLLTVDLANATAGQYMLGIDGTGPEAAYSENVTLEISSSPPISGTPLLPLDGAVDVSSNQTLHWTPDEKVYRYDVQVATDPAFSNIVLESTGISLSSLPTTALPQGATLYWRVVSYNACGNVTSPTWSFATAAASCTLYESNDVPKSISVNSSGSVSSVLLSNSNGFVVDINVVDMRGTHTFVGDLEFLLQGPVINAHPSRHAERAVVKLIERTCGSEDNFHVSLDEDAPPGPVPCPYNDAGTYQPTHAMTPFIGNPGTGDWTLIVDDNYPQDGGQLQGWGLEICTTPPPAELDSDGDGIADQADNCIDVFNPDQRDTHGDGYGNICDPDLNNDGIVNPADLGLLRSMFFQAGAGIDADFNGDDVVNPADLGIMKLYFFGPPGPSGAALD